MAQKIRFIALLVAFAGLWAYGSSASEPEATERVMTVLQETCLRCHGADRARGGLRLDSRDAALLGGDSGEAVLVPGNAAESPIMERLLAPDEDERMPQEAPALDAATIALFRKWIDAGAEWSALDQPIADGSTHWAFKRPVRPELPHASYPGWDTNPIDAFIAQGIDRVDLEPSAEAPRHTQMRRLSLDLLGLPPTPEEVQAFEEDESPDAYERLVERLLRSPHYGERQARHWLDAARYADTNGYEKDRARSMWPYRDWVIDAFNADMPYDQFIVEQLAGDLLPNPTLSQRIATGFHRNTMLNEEGGIDAEEDRFKRVVDRVNTTSTVFLGLTVGCAQCHSHKFDPISQREYYELFAFFNTTVETELPVPSEKIAKGRDEALSKSARIEDLMVWAGERNPETQSGLAAWKEETRAKCANWRVVRPSRVTSEKFATMIMLDDDSVLATGDIPNDDTYEIDLELDGAPITAIRLEVLPHESLPGGGPGRGVILAEGDFLLTSIEIEAAARDRYARVRIASATEDFAAEKNAAAQALDDQSDTGWSVKGALGKPHAAVFEFESPQTARHLRIRLLQDYIHQHTIGRFRLSVTSDQSPVVASGVPAGIEAALLDPTASESALVDAYYYQHVAPILSGPHERLESLAKDAPTYPTTLVFDERAEPRITRIHHRGEFLQPRDAVTANVPHVLHDFSRDLPRNRLGLAQWLVSEENPLLARVTMNRLWQQLFGRGLVTTPEDFGTRGAPPSHPELLDWLALEFIERDWSLKEMTRLIVNSAAYRQSSNVTPDALERDPENVWLARAPRVRADAEAIRDLALAASGLLNDRIGGPSVYPPQPEGVTNLAYGEPPWPTAEGPDRYRRGLYTYWKRTAPYAMATTFDAPTGEDTCVRRRRTNTPLQALALLNDTVFTEAAQALAARVIDESPRAFDERVRRLYRLCLARNPDANEIARIREYAKSISDSFDDEVTQTIAGIATDEEISEKSAERMAVWTLISRAVLNLDETITRE